MYFHLIAMTKTTTKNAKPFLLLDRRGAEFCELRYNLNFVPNETWRMTQNGKNKRYVFMIKLRKWKRFVLSDGVWKIIFAANLKPTYFF